MVGRDKKTVRGQEKPGTQIDTPPDIVFVAKLEENFEAPRTRMRPAKANPSGSRKVLGAGDESTQHRPREKQQKNYESEVAKQKHCKNFSSFIPSRCKRQKISRAR
jgi:hypothetical protein